MKFLCSHCKAKYQIADERVAGRTLRMTCRQCRQEIVIRGELTPVPRASMVGVPAPSALGTGLASHLAAGGATSPPPAATDQWHVAINDIPVGPMRREEVARKVQLGAVNAESLAWREGLDDWLPIRHIPELAVLLAGSVPAPSSPGLPPPPPPPMAAPSMAAGMHYTPPPSPAQRQPAAPIGGRTAAGAYTPEDWLPPQAEGSVSQVAPLPEAPLPTGAEGPSWHKMFAAMGAFAFLMAAMTILGAGWLSGDKQAAAPAPPPDAPSAPQPPANPASEEVDEEADEADEGKVVNLDLQEIDGAEQKNKAPAKTTGTSGSKKKLTAEQQAMLDRMGGGLNEGPAQIRGAGSTSAGRSTGGSGLTAAQLSKVVLNGRKNLQRCYETALRGSGSDDTVRLDVEITVSASGNVTKVNAKGKALPGMDTCIERTVKMWRFPNSGNTTQTKFPVVFQPGG